MKTFAVPILFFVLFSLILSIGDQAFAVSYFPPGLNTEEHMETLTATRGQTAYMFHSGSADEKRMFAVDDVLKVYREDRSGQMHEVATVKVLADAGENYYRIVVIAGEIRYGDVTRKGDVSCLIVLHRPGCANR